MFTEDLGMNGVELLGDAIEQLGLFGFELTVHQALSFRPVRSKGNSCHTASNRAERLALSHRHSRPFRQICTEKGNQV